MYTMDMSAASTRYVLGRGKTTKYVHSMTGAKIITAECFTYFTQKQLIMYLHVMVAY